MTRNTTGGLGTIVRKGLIRFLIAALLALTGAAGTARAAQSFSAVPSPGTPNVNTSYLLTMTLNGYIGNGTLVTPAFDSADTAGTAMYVPSAINASSIVVRSAGVTSSVTSPVVVAHQVSFRTNVVPDTHSISVEISSAGGLRPLTEGNHVVAVTVDHETLTTPYTIQQSTSSSSPIIISSVQAEVATLGAPSSYSAVFSLASTLSTSDTIYWKFPTGFVMPPTLDGSNFGLIQGARVVMDFSGNATIDGSTIALRIPKPGPSTGNSGSFDASAPLTLRCGPYTGIKNPSVGGTYTFEMWTSQQTTHASFALTMGTGVSSVNVLVDPTSAGAPASYTVAFITSPGGSLAAGTGTIQVTFPGGFTVPSTVPAGSVTVNGVAASATVTGSSIVIRVPTTVSASSQVSVAIARSAGIINGPVSAGGYRLTVSTSADQLPVQSNALTISASTVSAVSVAVLPAVKGATAAYTVNFTTGAGGALKSGDAISVFLPYGFMVPSTMAASQVTIKSPAGAAAGIQPASVACSPSAQSIVLTLPSAAAITAGTTVSVSLPAVITNPATGGTFTAKVSTSKETTAVDSQAFTIYNNPVSTLTLAPAAPDGGNSTYVTQPSFVLSVDGPAGTTLSAFYKLDDATTYTAYDLKAAPAVKVPEGRHTIAYYAQDNLGNVEPVRSQQVTVDLTDPVIAVSSPTAGGVVVQPAVSIVGRVTAKDTAGLQLTVAGKPVSVASDGAFTVPVSFDHEGVNTMELVATSASGRTGRLTLSVNYIARVTMSLVIGSPTVNLNNEFKTIEAAPFISKKGVTMVPLRFISEAFKADVAWDPVFKSVTIALGGKTMRIQVGFLTADVNGKSFALQDAPVIVNGRTFVPLRFIAENFGAQVDWNGQLKMVSIIYPKP